MMMRTRKEKNLMILRK